MVVHRREPILVTAYSQCRHVNILEARDEIKTVVADPVDVGDTQIGVGSHGLHGLDHRFRCVTGIAPGTVGGKGTLEELDAFQEIWSVPVDQALVHELCWC